MRRGCSSPRVLTLQIAVSYPVFFSSTVTFTNATREPSGEICGSPIQLNWKMSFSVIERFCAWARAAIAAAQHNAIASRRGNEAWRLLQRKLTLYESKEEFVHQIGRWNNGRSTLSNFRNFSARRVWDKIRIKYVLGPGPRSRRATPNQCACGRLCRAFGLLRLRFRKMPLWTRYGAITILLIAIIFAVYAAIPVEQAHLQIICQHSFRSAQLSVLVDGSVVYTSNVNVASRKRLGVLPKGQSGPEIFSKLIDVPTGRHVVQVRMSAPDEGFDQARSAAADFTSDRESILQVNATRRNTLL